MTHNPVVTFGTAAALIGFWAGQWFNPETTTVTNISVAQPTTVQGSAQTAAPLPTALTRFGEMFLSPETFGLGSTVLALIFWVAISAVFLIRTNVRKDRPQAKFTSNQGERK